MLGHKEPKASKRCSSPAASAPTVRVVACAHLAQVVRAVSPEHSLLLCPYYSRRLAHLLKIFNETVLKDVREHFFQV